MNDIEMVPVARVMTGRTILLLLLLLLLLLFTGAPELHAARRAELLHYHRSGKQSLLGAF